MAQTKAQARPVKLTRTCSLGAYTDSKSISDLSSFSSNHTHGNETRASFYTDWITRLEKKKGICKFSEDLKQTLSDGVLLADLISALTKCEVAHIDKSQLTDESKTLNVDRCLVHLQNLGYQTSTFNTRDITCARPKALSNLLDILFQAQQSSDHPMPTSHCNRAAPTPSVASNNGSVAVMKRTSKVQRQSGQLNATGTQRPHLSSNSTKVSNEKLRSIDGDPAHKTNQPRSSGLPRLSISTGNSTTTHSSNQNGLYHRPSSVNRRQSITSLNTETSRSRKTATDSVSVTGTPTTMGTHFAATRASNVNKPSTQSCTRIDCTSQTAQYPCYQSVHHPQTPQPKLDKIAHHSLPPDGTVRANLAVTSISPQHHSLCSSTNVRQHYSQNRQGNCVDEHSNLLICRSPVLPTQEYQSYDAQNTFKLNTFNRQPGAYYQLVKEEPYVRLSNCTNAIESHSNCVMYQAKTPISMQPQTKPYVFKTQLEALSGSLGQINSNIVNEVKDHPYPHTHHTIQNSCTPVVINTGVQHLTDTRALRHQLGVYNDQTCQPPMSQSPYLTASVLTPAEQLAPMQSTPGALPNYFYRSSEPGYRLENRQAVPSNVTKSFTFNSAGGIQRVRHINSKNSDISSSGLMPHINVSVDTPPVAQHLKVDLKHTTSEHSSFTNHNTVPSGVGLPSRLPIKRQSSYEISSLSRGSTGTVASYPLDIPRNGSKQQLITLPNSHSTASSLSAGDEKTFCDSGISSSSYSKDSACTSPSENVVVKSDEIILPLVIDHKCGGDKWDVPCCASSVSNDSVTQSSTDTIVQEMSHHSDISGCTTPDSSTLKTDSSISTISSSQLVLTTKKHGGRASRPTTISTSISMSTPKMLDDTENTGQSGDKFNKILLSQNSWEFYSPTKAHERKLFSAEQPLFNSISDGMNPDDQRPNDHISIGTSSYITGNFQLNDCDDNVGSNPTARCNKARSHTPEFGRKHRSNKMVTENIGLEFGLQSQVGTISTGNLAGGTSFQKRMTSHPVVDLCDADQTESEESVEHNTVVRKCSRSTTVKPSRSGRSIKEVNKGVEIEQCQNFTSAYAVNGNKLSNCITKPLENGQNREILLRNCLAGKQISRREICTDPDELLSKLSLASDLNDTDALDQNYFSDVESEYAALELVLPFTKSKRHVDLPRGSTSPYAELKQVGSYSEIRCKSVPKVLAEVIPFRRKTDDQFSTPLAKLPVASVAPMRANSRRSTAVRKKSSESVAKEACFKDQPSTPEKPKCCEKDAVDVQKTSPSMEQYTMVPSKPPLGKSFSSCTEDNNTENLGLNQKQGPLHHVRLPYRTNLSNTSPTAQVEKCAVNSPLRTSLSTNSMNVLSGDKRTVLKTKKEKTSGQDLKHACNTTEVRRTTITKEPEQSFGEPENDKFTEVQTTKIKELTAVNQLKDNEISELRKLISQLQQEIQIVKQARAAVVSTFQSKPTRSNSCRATNTGESIRLDQETASVASGTSGLSLTASDAQSLFGHSPSTSGQHQLTTNGSESSDHECNGNSKRSRWLRSPFTKSFNKRSRSSLETGDRTESSKSRSSTTATVFTGTGTHISGSQDLSTMTEAGIVDPQNLEQLQNLVTRLRWQMTCLLADNFRLRRLITKNPALMNELVQQSTNGLTGLSHRYCTPKEQSLRVVIHLTSQPSVISESVCYLTEESDSKRKQWTSPNGSTAFYSLTKKSKLLKIGCVGIGEDHTWEAFEVKLCQLVQDHIKFLDPEDHLLVNGSNLQNRIILLTIPAGNPSVTSSVNSHTPTSKTIKLSQENWSEIVAYLTNPIVWNSQADSNSHPYLTVQPDCYESHNSDQPADIIKWLSFDLLMPEMAMQCYLHAMKSHRTTILCGCPGTFKAKIIRKLVGLLLQEQQDQDASMWVCSTRHGDSLQRDSEMFTFLRKSLASFVESGYPKVILLEDLHRLDETLLTTLENMTEKLSGTWPKILATSDAELSHVEGMAVPTSVKILEHLMDVNSSAEFLERHLRRKVAQARLFHTHEQSNSHLSEEEDSLLIRIISWLSKVWKSVNLYPPNKGLSGPPLFGLHVFLSCPVDVEASKTWFLDLWNNLLTPFLFHHHPNRHSDSVSLANSFDWMVVTWPWISGVGWKCPVNESATAPPAGLCLFNEPQTLSPAVLLFGATPGLGLNGTTSHSHLSLDTHFGNSTVSNITRPLLPDNRQNLSSSRCKSRSIGVTFSANEQTSVKLHSFLPQNSTGE